MITLVWVWTSKDRSVCTEEMQISRLSYFSKDENKRKIAEATAFGFCILWRSLSYKLHRAKTSLIRWHLEYISERYQGCEKIIAASSKSWKTVWNEFIFIHSIPDASAQESWAEFNWKTTVLQFYWQFHLLLMKHKYLLLKTDVFFFLCFILIFISFSFDFTLNFIANFIANLLLSSIVMCFWFHTLCCFVFQSLINLAILFSMVMKKFKLKDKLFGLSKNTLTIATEASARIKDTYQFGSLRWHIISFKLLFLLLYTSVVNVT